MTDVDRLGKPSGGRHRDLSAGSCSHNLHSATSFTTTTTSWAESAEKEALMLRRSGNFSLQRFGGRSEQNDVTCRLFSPQQTSPTCAKRHFRVGRRRRFLHRSRGLLSGSSSLLQPFRAVEGLNQIKPPYSLSRPDGQLH